MEGAQRPEATPQTAQARAGPGPESGWRGDVGFPMASAADIIRAAEKDEQCLGWVEEAGAEVVRSVAGPFGGIGQEDTVRMLVRLAYYGLTVGMARHTLGEEYCSLIQVVAPASSPALAAPSGPGFSITAAHPPSRARSIMLVLLHSLAPHLLLRANSAAVRWGNAAEAQHPFGLDPPATQAGLDAEEMQGAAGPDAAWEQREGSGGEAEGAPGWRRAQGENTEQRGGDKRRVGGEGEEESRSAEERAETERESTGSHDGAISASASSGPAASSAHMATARGRVRAGVQRVVRAALIAWCQTPTQAALAECYALLQRAHLMLFYFYGHYFQWPMRLAAIHLAFTSRPSSFHPRYSILGLLLLLQLCVQGTQFVTRILLPGLHSSLSSLGLFSLLQGTRPGQQDKSREGDDEKEEEEGQGWVPVSAFRSAQGGQSGRESAGEQALESGAWDSTGRGSEGGTSSSRCALCLACREQPTSTPCGHVFCWKCVTEWCNEKQECPLCRSPMTHSSLVVVYHSDF